MPSIEQASDMYIYADQEKGRGGNVKSNSSTMQIFQNSRGIIANIFLKYVLCATENTEHAYSGRAGREPRRLDPTVLALSHSAMVYVVQSEEDFF